MKITLVWPPASLSGHAKGSWKPHAALVRKHRSWAAAATRAAKVPAQPASGDIPIHIIFTPPDRRGDRTNYPNRIKAGLDGIAEALGVNDRRFAPSYEFRDPKKPGKVEVVVG